MLASSHHLHHVCEARFGISVRDPGDLAVSLVDLDLLRIDTGAPHHGGGAPRRGAALCERDAKIHQFVLGGSGGQGFDDARVCGKIWRR